jgi:hypothetical protein
LYVETYGFNRKVSATGWSLFLGKELAVVQSATLEEALWMIELGHLSQATYLEFRLRLLDRFVLPPVMHVTAENRKHRPALTEYKNGVRAPLAQCLRLTLSERLAQIDLSGLGQVTQIEFKLNWGLDGSGEHPNHHQLSKIHFTTKQVMLVCFALKEVRVKDADGAEASWISSQEGANKPQNVRPLAIFPSKEDRPMLAEIVPMVDRVEKNVVVFSNMCCGWFASGWTVHTNS